MHAIYLNRGAVCALLAMTVILGGCATGAGRDAMSTGAMQVARKHPHSVSVDARGGSDTGAMGSSNISDADMKAAIGNTISLHLVLQF